MLINEANIEINKINVIGGVNGSGKSTLSKYLYSFLKANSSQRRPYFIHKIVDNINYDIEYLNDMLVDEDSTLELLDIEDDYFGIRYKYEKALKRFDKYFIKFQNHNEELNKKLFDAAYDIYKKFSVQGVDVSSIQGYFNEKESFRYNNFWDFIKFLRENNFKEYSSSLYGMYFENRKFLNSSFGEFNERKNNIKTANRLIENYFIQEDGPYLSRKIANFILYDEWVPALLDLKNSSDYMSLRYNSNDSKSIIKFSMNKNSQNFDAFEYFFDNGFMGNVFYVDNVSILDFEKRNSKFKIYHVAEIINSLYPKNSMAGSTSQYDDDTRNILEKIEDIVEGKYDKNGHDFWKRKPSNKYKNTLQFRNSFADKEFRSIMDVHSLPSGIKQIGIIELLLRNYKFKEENCFLIIDEPEVNLHPTWQFKFAEILVLLAKNLNVTIYLNSHSPMFIEAIDAFCEFYDMEDDVNYYLTQKLDNENKYNFIKIKSNQLYKLYNNLGDGYKLINKLRIRKSLNK